MANTVLLIEYDGSSRTEEQVIRLISKELCVHNYIKEICMVDISKLLETEQKLTRMLNGEGYLSLIEIKELRSNLRGALKQLGINSFPE